MSSEPPPTAHGSTKYESIPPRFRKVWIKGHSEKIQKKLNSSTEDFSFSMPNLKSISDTNLPVSVDIQPSRSSSVGASVNASSASASSPSPHKRPRTSESSASGIASGGSNIKGDDKEASTTPIAYSGPSSMRQIVDSVVGANVAISTPPASRSHSPLGDPSSRGKYRQASVSRPATRTNSPNPGTRASTPAASGWSALTSRHSFRRFDIRPWGPRHLEYDYNKARKEFQAAAYRALGQYGYEPPKGVAKYKAPPLEELPSMSDLRKIPEFGKVCRKLDAADRALEEALAQGATWENTPIPEEYLQLSLEDVEPEDFCIQRPDNTTVQDRSRSSVTLEEAAGQLKSSMLGRPATTTTSATTSASASDKGPESVIAGEAQSSRGTSPLAKMTLSDEDPPSPPVPASSQTGTSSPTNETPQEESQKATSAIPSEATTSTLVAGADVPQPQIGRKRQLSEVETEGKDDSKEGKGKGDIPVPSPVPTRVNSPIPPKTTETTGKTSLGRTESDSTAGSGSASGLGEAPSTNDSPPTSVASGTSKEPPRRGRGGRVTRARGRKRGRGRGRGA